MRRLLARGVLFLGRPLYPLYASIMLALCRRLYPVYQQAYFSIRIQCGHRPLRLPIICAGGIDVIDFEDPRMQGVIQRLRTLRPEGTFVDVGANAGAMLLNLLATGAKIPYLGFEPDITAAFRLAELIRLNELPDCSVLPIALAARQGVGTLHSARPADTSATLGLETRSLQMFRMARHAAVWTGDEALAPLVDSIFLLKLDVEGLEIEALTGMEKLLAARRPPIYFEVNGYGHLLKGTYSRTYLGGELSPTEVERLVRNRKANMERLRGFLAEREYGFLRCHHEGLERVSTLDPGPDRDASEMNYLAVPSEWYEEFIERRDFVPFR